VVDGLGQMLHFLSLSLILLCVEGSVPAQLIVHDTCVILFLFPHVTGIYHLGVTDKVREACFRKLTCGWTVPGHLYSSTAIGATP
jgi:hypothetical protein